MRHSRIRPRLALESLSANQSRESPGLVPCPSSTVSDPSSSPYASRERDAHHRSESRVRLSRVSPLDSSHVFLGFFRAVFQSLSKLVNRLASDAREFESHQSPKSPGLVPRPFYPDSRGLSRSWTPDDIGVWMARKIESREASESPGLAPRLRDPPDAIAGTCELLSLFAPECSTNPAPFVPCLLPDASHALWQRLPGSDC